MTWTRQATTRPHFEWRSGRGFVTAGGTEASHNPDTFTGVLEHEAPVLMHFCGPVGAVASWPKELSPQHTTPPLETSAQVLWFPIAIAEAPLNPDTTTGVDEFVVVPFPNSPDQFKPQHRTVPSERTAHASAMPAAMAVTPERLGTFTGVVAHASLLLVHVWGLLAIANPSSPSPFAPQHATVPSAISAQVLYQPVAMAVAPVMPDTGTGVVAFVVDPLPSWPASLVPQHSMVPSRNNAQA